MPKRLFQLHSPPRWVVATLGLVLLSLVGYIDKLTGPQLFFSVFYLIPIAVFAWHLGRLPGCVMAMAATVVWGYLNPVRGYESPFHLLFCWNTFVRFSSFVVVALLVDACHRLSIKVESLVAQQTAVLTAELAHRREAEEAIHNLAAQLSVAEDAERKRLAQDIHDTLGQNLTALKLSLQAAAAGRAVTGAGAGLEPFQGSLHILDSLIEQTRSLTFDLYPAMLEDLGLAPTLRRHAEQFCVQTAIRASVTEVGAPQPLPSYIATSMFRATKELMNNAAKHGPAKEILISLRWRTNGLRIVVDDDGKGFDTQTALQPQSRRGLGLAWISERLNSLGGQFLVESSPDSGSRVILDIAFAPRGD